MHTAEKITPLMRQYFETKEKFRDSLLFFQVGDFYELFFEDAKQAASFLGIALTKRGMHNGEPVPLCGVPLHASNFYIAKLVHGGYKVAVCDQLEEAVPGKVVKRGVREVMTPGTLTDSTLLDEKSASYLAVVYPCQQGIALIFGELLTGTLSGTFIENNQAALESELARVSPQEVLIPQTTPGKHLEPVIKKLGFFTTARSCKFAHAEFDNHFMAWYQQLSINQSFDYLQAALYIFYEYLRDHHESALRECKQFQSYQVHDFMVLDSVTQRNLELVKNAHDGSRKDTLFSVLDNAMTPMGSRMIKKWLVRPLIDQKKIESRLVFVEYLVSENTLRDNLRHTLKSIGDLERIIGRIALERAALPDYRALHDTLPAIPDIARLLLSTPSDLMTGLARRLSDFSALHDVLTRSINLDSAHDIIIKSGFDEELDRLHALVNSGTQAIAELERREQQATGIQSLKIRYTSVHGYYIEITKANYHLVPERYQRTQTLAGRERYTTRKLKDLERDIERAHSEINAVEKEVFERVKQEVMRYLQPLQKTSQALAYLDAMASFADTAYQHNFVKPHFNDRREIRIEGGRHLVVEHVLEGRFIANDVHLHDDESLWIITGPNMGGKSTFLRQVALICIMVQCGSFVPARSASLPIIDRIFTRIGASDNVAHGKSTFLVEMEETAIICQQATKQSLVILDEVGRGTSTFDGLAIAQSVVEYLHTTIGCRGLFATHYHELIELERAHHGITSYHAAMSRHQERVVFLYKMLRGAADGSFGIDVAELAQLPKEVVQRAREIARFLSSTS